MQANHTPPTTSTLRGIVIQSNRRAVEYLCELCGVWMVSSVPASPFWHDSDNNAFPICWPCALHRGALIDHRVVAAHLERVCV